MCSPTNFLYEPFSSDAVTQNYDQNLKCTKCGAYYSMACSLREQNVWTCLFCNQSNSNAELPLVPSNTYTLTSAKKEILSRRTIMIIDAICDPHELNYLVSILCNNYITRQQEPLSIITIQQSGHVILHNAVNHKRDAVFSINEFMTKYNLDKLNASYFEKKISEINQESYWFDKSTQGSLRKLLREICKIANKANISSKRDKRCTGLALFVSSVLASQCSLSAYCHIVSFLNGPCTKGGGKVMSRERGESMRQNHHFESKSSQLQLSKSSTKFYKKMLEKFANQTLIYEFFIASLDQIGILEMSPLITSSMAVSQFDSFNDERFAMSFQKYLNLRDHNAIYNCHSKIMTAKNAIVVKDFPKYSLNPKNLSLPLEISLGHNSAEAPIQFQTTFENRTEKYIRIETLLLPKANRSFGAQNEIVFSMKKIASRIIDSFAYSSKHTKELMKQLFLLPNQIRGKDVDMVNLIQWCYHIYRSPILSVRNTSPDERYLFLHRIINASKDTCLSLCKPFIWSYSDLKHDWIVLDVPLTRAQILQDDKTTICVDGGSYLVLRRGKLLEKEGRELCCKLLNDMQRFPQPLYVETKTGCSQDRFLKSKIIPLDITDKETLGTEDMTFNEYFNLFTDLSGSK
ncbi:BTE_HP_G0078440.mRNA.1.CDS.1 [Saccharomyces cerevisiae]|nr:BTE_HP_G0020720.mRNA.1.CDS.1 [Saccharomyces cerevisiae]CAI5024987.1 BTE_HP_G0078440.mRNA.1.CDS.1 [Saccharomyces cerevisiae]CAI6604402.1 BTE_HP_G0020720.mRNA.1.CDS.1 [Saccharomyces cerevisiae]CAI6941077.1 BTE_HP_G0078440.mRNA.1.CDS.1 [Saccharomyces cerevisiae]